MTAPDGHPARPTPLRARARWALAFRLARREARRHPWRHALVVLLIFVPVLATFVTFSGMQTAADLDDARTRAAAAGADALIDLRQPGIGSPDHRAVELAHPSPGVHIERMWQGVDWLVPRSGGDTHPLEPTATIAVPRRGRLEERFRVDEGRLPRRRDEVFLTAAAAEVGGWHLGDEVELATSDLRFRVVGTGVLRSDVTDRVVALSDELPESFWTRSVGDAVSSVELNGSFFDANQQTEQAAVWVPDDRDPFSLEPVRSAGAYQYTGSSGATDPAVGIGISVAGAGLAMVAAVVASAAFAIGARRQLRNVGLLATAGADPSVVRAALVLQGALPGVMAAGLAVVVTVLAATAATTRDLLVDITGVADAHIVLSPTGAVVATIIGIGAGIAAAWQPARSTARLPLLSALGGRRPLPPVRTRVPLAGVGAIAVGFGLLAISRRAVAEGPDIAAVIPIVGVICFALGAVGLAPALVAALGPVSRRVTGLGRLSLRGLVRHRGQSAATVAAVAVALALPIGLLTTNPHPANRPLESVGPDGTRPLLDAVRPGGLAVVVSGEESSYAATAAKQAAVRRTYQRREADVVRALDAPAVRVATVEVPVAAEAESQLGLDDVVRIAVIDDVDLDAVLQPWAARQLARGRLLAASYPSAPTATLGPAGAATELDLAEVPGGGQAWVRNIPADLVLSRSTSARLQGVRTLDTVTFLRAVPPDHGERDQLGRLSGASGQTRPTLAQVRAAVAQGAIPATEPADGGTFDGVGPVAVSVDVIDSGRAELDPWTVLVLAMAAAGTVLALLVLTITLSLRAVDGADDARAALAAGAAPAAARRVRAIEGAVLTALGAALALPLGWLPVVALRVGIGPSRWFPGPVGPGWLAVPVLAAPVVLVGVLWTLVPALRAALTGRRGGDLLLPRG